LEEEEVEEEEEEEEMTGTEVEAPSCNVVGPFDTRRMR